MLDGSPDRDVWEHVSLRLWFRSLPIQSQNSMSLRKTLPMCGAGIVAKMGKSGAGFCNFGNLSHSCNMEVLARSSCFWFWTFLTWHEALVVFCGQEGVAKTYGKAEEQVPWHVRLKRENGQVRLKSKWAVNVSSTWAESCNWIWTGLWPWAHSHLHPSESTKIHRTWGNEGVKHPKKLSSWWFSVKFPSLPKVPMFEAFSVSI